MAMSFLKRLFGGGKSGGGQIEPVSEVEYEGFKISVTPQKEGGQFRLCGLISKEIDGEVREHKLIRADMLSSIEDAKDATVRKAKQVIDEQGDRLLG